MINQTTIIVISLLAVLLFTVSKRNILVPFILCACFVPTDQRVVIFDLDFTAMRILVLVGLARTIARGERSAFRLNNLDKLVFAWIACGAIVYVIQWADTRALIYECGVVFDLVGLYWLFRININTWEDIKRSIRTFAICCLVLTGFVWSEWATGENPFILLGRVATSIRDGRYRCQASFPHAIMLGLFWVTLVPLFIGVAREGKHKRLLYLAVAAASFIAVATASSTPILTLFIAVALVFGYRWRSYTSCASWAFLAFLIALHVAMKAPVWHLLARVSVVGGSTGWHRYYLINEGIKHFSEWALLGCRSTIHWGLGLDDITNQYLLEGVRGGVATLALFLIVIYTALRTSLRLSLKSRVPQQQQFLAWCAFAAVLGHCVAFLGVAYFGQIIMWWYMTLAIVSFLHEEVTSGLSTARCQTASPRAMPRTQPSIVSIEVQCQSKS